MGLSVLKRGSGCAVKGGHELPEIGISKQTSAPTLAAIAPYFLQGTLWPTWETIPAKWHIFLMLCHPRHKVTVMKVRTRVGPDSGYDLSEVRFSRKHSSIRCTVSLTPSPLTLAVARVRPQRGGKGRSQAVCAERPQSHGGWGAIEGCLRVGWAALANWLIGPHRGSNRHPACNSAPSFFSQMEVAGTKDTTAVFEDKMRYLNALKRKYGKPVPKKIE